MCARAAFALMGDAATAITPSCRTWAGMRRHLLHHAVPVFCQIEGGLRGERLHQHGHLCLEILAQSGFVAGCDLAPATRAEAKNPQCKLGAVCRSPAAAAEKLQVLNTGQCLTLDYMLSPVFGIPEKAGSISGSSMGFHLSRPV